MRTSDLQCRCRDALLPAVFMRGRFGLRCVHTSGLLLPRNGTAVGLVEQGVVTASPSRAVSRRGGILLSACVWLGCALKEPCRGSLLLHRVSLTTRILSWWGGWDGGTPRELHPTHSLTWFTQSPRADREGGRTECSRWAVLAWCRLPPIPVRGSYLWGVAHALQWNISQLPLQAGCVRCRFCDALIVSAR